MVVKNSAHWNSLLWRDTKCLYYISPLCSSLLYSVEPIPNGNIIGYSKSKFWPLQSLRSLFCSPEIKTLLFLLMRFSSNAFFKSELNKMPSFVMVSWYKLGNSAIISITFSTFAFWESTCCEKTMKFVSMTASRSSARLQYKMLFSCNQCSAGWILWMRIWNFSFMCCFWNQLKGPRNKKLMALESTSLSELYLSLSMSLLLSMLLSLSLSSAYSLCVQS